MNMGRGDGDSDRSLEERISNEIRKEAEGRSDGYVQENYEDAASLMRSAANRYDKITSREGNDREVAKVGAELREREAAWKAWSELAEERSQAADLAEERKLEALERNDGASRETAGHRPSDKSEPEPTSPGRSERLVATEYAPDLELRDIDHVAIYGGEHALLIATTGPADEQASHDRASRLVNDPDFRRIVSDAYPETKDAIGKGTFDGPGDYRFEERLAALVRDGATDRPEVVITGPVAEGMLLASAMAESKSIQASMAPASPERGPDPAKEFRVMSQAERLQDSRMNAGAKAVAALDAAIDRKYGASTPEAHIMKQAARESVAQTLERGGAIRVPRVREEDRRREDLREQARPQDRDANERDR